MARLLETISGFLRGDGQTSFAGLETWRSGEQIVTSYQSLLGNFTAVSRWVLFDACGVLVRVLLSYMGRRRRWLHFGQTVYQVFGNRLTLREEQEENDKRECTSNGWVQLWRKGVLWEIYKHGKWNKSATCSITLGTYVKEDMVGRHGEKSQ